VQNELGMSTDPIRRIAGASLCLATLYVTPEAQAQETGSEEPRFGGSGAAIVVGSVLLQTGIGSAHILGLMTLDSTIVCEASDIGPPGQSSGGCPPSPKLGAPYFFIPVVGPFLAMDRIDAQGGQAGLYAATGVAQIAGLTTLIVALSVRAAEDDAIEPPAAVVAPVITPDSYGAALTASF
jgi:hypothetical protein